MRRPTTRGERSFSMQFQPGAEKHIHALGGSAARLVSCYSYFMSSGHREAGKLTLVWRAIVEVGIIVFLSYSALLMREFTHTNGQGKTFVFAIKDIFTLTSLVVAVISGLIAYIVFEYLRKQL